jgi:queuine tRNA-ribosyltransferase
LRIADWKLDRPIRNPTSAIRNNLVFDFTVEATAGRARSGILQLPHGTVETPCFMPVGTQGTVRTLSPNDLRAVGATLLLANTYHLHVRPGEDVVAQLGALHRFMSWDRPLLTDSGGFQVFSLEGFRRVSEDGVEFQSHVDGSRRTLTPERAVEIQWTLGADIAMAFDHVVPGGADEATARDALERTLRWLERCGRRHAELADGRMGGRADGTAGTDRPFAVPPVRQALWPILQGGAHRALREEGLRRILDANSWTGLAIGGLSVGEPKPVMYQLLEILEPRIPSPIPRYLMGVGFPEDLVAAVERGVDLFDCVAPTRNGRNGSAFTPDGPLNIRNAEHRADPRPLDDACDCETCTTFSRGYLRHLFVAEELLGLRLLSLHNVRYLIRLAQDMRAAIRRNAFGPWADAWRRRYLHTRTA